MKKRLTVRYIGRVQGVGFRWESCRMARGLGLAGWVKNMPDGSVQLVAEGPEVELHAFLDEMQHSRLQAGIRDRLLAWGPALNRFDEFEISP